IGMNLWVDENGEVWFYLSKSDAWSGAGLPVKAGRFRLVLRAADGGPVLLGEGFEWTLDLEKAEIHIRSARAALRVWIDANAPVVRFQAKGQDLTATVVPELRDAPRSEVFFTRMKALPPWNQPLPPFHNLVDADGLVWF